MTKPSPLTGALTLLLLGLPLLGLPARAESGPPDLNIERTCRSAASASVSDNASQEGCLRSERASRDEVKRRWNEFTPAAKRQCEKQFQAGGFPSYVEMVTCLELASGTGLPKQADESRAGKGTSSATRGPSPAQRTDPIKVLKDQ